MPHAPTGDHLAHAVNNIGAGEPPLLQQRACDALVMPPCSGRDVAQLPHRHPPLQVARILDDEGVAESTERVPYH
eukprot:2810779-Pyramimonas_sp.AAC.1